MRTSCLTAFLLRKAVRSKKAYSSFFDHSQLIIAQILFTNSELDNPKHSAPSFFLIILRFFFLLSISHFCWYSRMFCPDFITLFVDDFSIYWNMTKALTVIISVINTIKLLPFLLIFKNTRTNIWIVFRPFYRCFQNFAKSLGTLFLY